LEIISVSLNFSVRNLASGFYFAVWPFISLVVKQVGSSQLVDKLFTRFTFWPFIYLVVKQVGSSQLVDALSAEIKFYFIILWIIHWIHLG